MGNAVKCIKRTIKTCDCFGTFISFRINNDLDYKSLIGGITTIIFVLFTIVYVSINAVGFVTRTNISFISTNKIVFKDPFVDLLETKYAFAFGVQYPDEQESDTIGDFKDYFNYEINLVDWIGESDMRVKKIKLKYCEYKDFYNEAGEAFEMNSIDDFLCPDLTEMEEFNLKGLYTDEVYRFLEFKILLTDKGIEEKEIVMDKMKEKKIEMALFFLDTAIDYKNMKKPLPVYINYLVKGLDYRFSKLTDVSISAVEFTNDENILFSHGKTTKAAIFDSSLDTFNYFEDRQSEKKIRILRKNGLEEGLEKKLGKNKLINKENIEEKKDQEEEEEEENDEYKILGKFTVKASPKVYLLDRAYQKFPEFLADTTSILEEILVVMLLIINVFERKLVDHKLIEKMLKFRGSKYYDIDYLVKVFNRDKISDEVVKLLNDRNLKLEKQENIVSKRRSIMDILQNDKNIENMRNNYNKIGLPKISEEDKNMINMDVPVNEEILNINNKSIKSNRSNSMELINTDRYNANKDNNLKKLNNNPSGINNDNGEGKDCCEKNCNKKDDLNMNFDYPSSKSNGNKNGIYSHDENLNDDEYLSSKTNLGYKKFNICQIMCASLCSWVSKKQKKRNIMIQRAESKIHYYLDIYTYIKKMQEIDLLKYCLFSDEQMELFEFLSKPPIRMSNRNDSIYVELEKQQETKRVLKEKEIDVLFRCYKNICDKKNYTFEDIKLIRLVKAEIDFLK